MSSAMSSADQMRLRYARDQHLKSETEKFRDLNKIQAFVKRSHPHHTIFVWKFMF